MKGAFIFIMVVVTFPVYGQLQYRGVDISYWNRVMDTGGVFSENGDIRPLPQILEDNGINLVRLRIWHSPDQGYNNLQGITDMALLLKPYNFKFLLDFHYSDTWADPGNQTQPAAWADADFESLRDSVYNYTYAVLSHLKQHDVLPDMVQIGNEISNGMLWDDGRVGGPYNTDIQWYKLSQLLKAGIRAVQDVGKGSIPIMIHTDQGGNAEGIEWFFDRINGFGVPYHLIGLSYYPWWHGSFENLTLALERTANKYGKPIHVVETAYPWTLNWADNQTNIVGLESQVMPGFPASPMGQYRFLDTLQTIIAQTPHDLGVGICYWAPEWIPTATDLTPWENLALFDFDGKSLVGWTAFQNHTPTEVSHTQPTFFNASVYPNPFNPVVTLSISGLNYEPGDVVLYSITGERLTTLDSFSGGLSLYRNQFNLSHYSSGTYFIQITTSSNRMTIPVFLVK